MARPARLVALDVSDELGGLVVELLLRVRGPAAADLDAFADSLLGPGTVAVGLFDLETSRLAGLVAALTDERSLALVVELVAERGPNRLAIEQRLMHELLARPELANISDIELLTDPDLTTRNLEPSPERDAEVVALPAPLMTIRTIYASEWEERVTEAGALLVYRVRGSGFLHHMVRNLVGTMLEVGRGKLRASQIPEILAARNRDAAGPTAPARGLFLVSVEYDEQVDGPQINA